MIGYFYMFAWLVSLLIFRALCQWRCSEISIVTRSTLSHKSWGDQNRRKKFSIGGFAFLREALGLCWGAWHSKIWRKLNWFIVFHVSIWEGLELCLGGLSPQKPPRGDGTGGDGHVGKKLKNISQCCEQLLKKDLATSQIGSTFAKLIDTTTMPLQPNDAWRSK